MTSQRPRGAEHDRSQFPHGRSIPTRWMDNDAYGHVNNVVYYSLFDTVINAYLVDAGALDIQGGSTIGLAVETGCRFFRSVAFPEVLEARLRVAHLGTSSVRYEIGIFTAGRTDAAAFGHFIHVFVDRETRAPQTMPPPLRAALSALMPPRS